MKTAAFYTQLKKTLLACVVLCGSLSYSLSPKPQPKKEVWITIFIHGIMSIAPHLNLHNFTLFMRDDIIDTVYARTVNLMRQDSFFHLNQAMQDFGIHELDPQKLKTNDASNAIARIYDEITHNSNLPKQKNYYYTYGWSGLLSPRQRYVEAEGLLIAIQQLKAKFALHGITPKIRIIGYSHGGNVALNIAAIHHDKYPTINVSVDELILVGTPIQFETDTLIKSSLFKKVYHFYSRLDRIQRIDFFSDNRFFSGRLFKDRKNFKLPKKLTQVQLKVTRLRSTKKNKRKHRQNALSLDNPANIAGQRRLLRDISPGHIEMWFFGWTPGKYRDHFPLAPLPAFVLIPFIIGELNKHINDLTNPHPIIVDIRPELDTMLIKQYKRNKFILSVPFIEKKKLETIKSYARAVEPKSYTNEDYQNHIEIALEKARKEYDTQKAEAEPIKTPRRRRRFRRTHESASAVDRHYKFLEPLG